MTAPQAERKQKILKLQAQQAEKLAKEEEKKWLRWKSSRLKWKQQAVMEDENKKVQEASIDALRQSSLEFLFEHEDGSQSYMTFKKHRMCLKYKG